MLPVYVSVTTSCRCLVMREVGGAAVSVVILCLCQSVPTALSLVFLSHYVTGICSVTTSCRCLVMREVGGAAVSVVILCLCQSLPTALSVVFLSHYVTG